MIWVQTLRRGNSLCASKLIKYLPFNICMLIPLKAGPISLFTGSSSYSRCGRAKLIGRCLGSYRGYPGFYFTTRGDNTTCAPGLSYKRWVESFIRFGHLERMG
uniref:RNA silencing suppressor n=1 Tax=Cowpea mild mottle virus TaxID=67761 RepID=X2D386_9VIRU|nr:nucleic acid binding protein [Cowpea mild mottle virus]